MKTLLPKRIKHFLREIHRQFVLNRTIHKIATLGEGEIPNRRLLEDLRYGWGKIQWSASTDYLKEMSRLAVETKGPILECGSGLSTLLLGLLLKKRSIKALTLEHDSKWYNRIQNNLNKFRIENIELCLVPL